MSSNLTLFQLFYIFSTFLCITFAVAVFFSENSIHSVFSLLFLVLFVSILLLGVLGVEFLAVACIMIYAGALIVTFLFVIISADLRREDTILDVERLKKYNYISPSCFIFLNCCLSCFFIEQKTVLAFFDEFYMQPAGEGTNIIFNKVEFSNDIFVFSNTLYDQFFLFFLLLGLLLCVAMVASVSLCFRPINAYGQTATSI